MGAPARVQQDQQCLCSSRMKVPLPAWHSGLKDPELPQLWCRLKLQLRSDPWPGELPYVTGRSGKRKEGRKERRKKRGRKAFSLEPLSLLKKESFAVLYVLVSLWRAVWGKVILCSSAISSANFHALLFGACIWAMWSLSFSY